MTTHRLLGSSCSFYWFLFSMVAAPFAFADEIKSGIVKREAWTTSKIQGTPEPPLPFVTERAFPGLKFDRCLDIAMPRGGKRFYVAEQSGKILSFVNEPNVQKADLVLDVAKAIPDVRSVYAITFHPEFEKNRYCYVCYIKAPNLEDGTHVVRFQVSNDDPPTIDPKTETRLITWFSGGHNGCCLKFGPDGYLYISTGDAAPANPPDTKRAGQDVSNLLSAILRIDVDRTEGERNYRIPPDNPFVKMDGARGEIWAYGFRNPWRMSFDKKTGDLWVGDVGWELWEMLDRVERGGNYGWGVMEGRQLTQPEWPRGPTPILPPTIDHPHSESSSITDGLTYYGSRLKELHGAHVYGDYDTGKFWAFRWVDGKVVDHREIADTTLRIVGFGADETGEFYILDHPAGTIHRLAPNPNRNRESDFPRRLSETGLFRDTAQQIPEAGVVPYSINAEPWEDFAASRRFVAAPGESTIQGSGDRYTFPKDAVLVKTRSIEMVRGDAATRRNIETQILHFDGAEWYPYTYRWNDQQTDARLVASGGDEQTLKIEDPAAPGGEREQVWRFAGRAECQRCHNKWSGPPLAFHSPQLNRVHDYGGRDAHQLATLSHIKLIDKLGEIDKLPKLENPYGEGDITRRARAYLQVNCAHCHRMHAGSAVLSYMHHDLSLEKTNMVAARPSQGTFGIHAAQVIAPGDPFRSVLLYRMSKLGGGRMPRLGSGEVDRAGVALMRDWIAHLTRDSSKDAAGEALAAKLRSGERELISRLQSGDAAKSETVDKLLSSTSGAMLLLQAIEDDSVTDELAATAVASATRHEDVTIRDLFEPYLPANERVQRLGAAIQPDKILALKGDAKRGEKLFQATAGIQCKNCHQVRKQGHELGPDLTTIAKKLSRAELLESVLQPSKRVDPKYVSYLAEMKDGRLLTGLLIAKNEKQIVLRDGQRKEIKLAPDAVERLVPQGKSLMPELLLRDMTAQQAADLLEYLSSLR